MNNRKGASISEWRSIVAAIAQKGSRSSPRGGRSKIEQMDHDVSVLASRLEEDFSCVSSTMSSDVWYIDGEASAHMMGVRDYFSDYQEERMNFKITMGNKAKCTPIGRGTVVVQTEARNRIQATNKLHVLGLGMNLLSVSQLQNRGYDIYFIGNRVYVKHPSWKKKAQIGVRSNKLYKLQLDSLMALVGSADETDLNELAYGLGNF